MSIKSKNKRVEICLMFVTSSLVLAAVWAVLATPETALAGKPVKPDDTIYYSVTMTGDLTIVGAFSFVDGECSVEPSPTGAWARSFNAGILVNRPLPAVCIANAFLDKVTLDGDVCDEGVIPHGDGPNWGTLFVEGDDNGVIVKYSIGETDDETGKCKRYTLSTNETVMPVRDGTVYTVTIPGPVEGTPGMSWSLVQNKPGKLNMTLTSTQDTVIEFTETGP